MLKNYPRGWGILSGAIFLIFSINFLVFLVFYNNFQQDVATHKVKSEYLLDNLTKSVESYFKEFESIADSLLDYYSIHGSNSNTDIILRGHKFRHPSIHDILIVDRNGEIAHWTAFGPKPDIRDRPYFTQHARQKAPERLFVSEPMASRLYDGRWFISLSRRRVDAAGQFDGSVAVLLDLQSIADFFQPLLTEDGYEFHISHASNRLLATIPPNLSLIGRRYREPEAGGTYIVVKNPVPGLPLTTSVRFDLSRIVGQWAGRAWIYGLLVLALDVIAGFLLWQLKRRYNERAAMFQAVQDAREAAQRATEEKSRFLATMSHEIRTPMSSVIGMLEILKFSSLTAKQSQILEVVEQSSESLLRIVNDILDFSKIEAGRLKINPEPTRIAPLIENIAMAHSGNASSKGLVMGTVINLPVERAYLVDALRLRQILTNLLSNAIKFTESGSVTLSVSCDSREQDRDILVFEVADTGVGIAKERIGRLFAPFTQADASVHEKFGGTGLGLSICRRLADLMGGTIELSSEVGIGTTVTLTLALEQVDGEFDKGVETRGSAEYQPRLRPTPSIEDAAKDGSLILVADDHPVNRAMLVRQLDMIGYAAEAAKDGIEAFEMWCRNSYGLLITDINMPRLDGISLAKRIRDAELNHTTRTPIISKRCLGTLIESSSSGL